MYKNFWKTNPKWLACKYEKLLCTVEKPQGGINSLLPRLHLPSSNPCICQTINATYIAYATLLWLYCMAGFSSRLLNYYENGVQVMLHVLFKARAIMVSCLSVNSKLCGVDLPVLFSSLHLG